MSDRMTPGPHSQRLLHITHARQDDAWVRGVMIPALGLTEDQYWTRAEEDLGALRLEELERAVQSCRYTLLVASTAANVDEWTKFAGIIAQHLGIEEGKPRLLIVTRDFDPSSQSVRELFPLRQRCLVSIDCSDSERAAPELMRLAEQLALATSEHPDIECPYPGLRMFGTGDHARCFTRTDLFFGRDEEGSRILAKLLGEARRVLVVGPSGCGKSSLIRARVLPVVGDGPEAMAIAVVQPGAHPDIALRAAVCALDPRLGPATDAWLGDDNPAAVAASRSADQVMGQLLYIDQLEEVFLDDTPGSQRERAQFFARLAALGRLPGIVLVLSMRADFYGDFMRSPAWDDFKDHRVELAPLRGAALRQAIVRPAALCGVHVEVDLVERLVREADLDRAAEMLPLLQVALEQLWMHREWRYLSLRSYERLADGQGGGLDAVLARHADSVMAGLSEAENRLARRVLIDLVHFGEGRPDTRRRRTIAELRRAGEEDPALARVLAHLSAHRLICVGAGEDRYVDLAHDALITGWPALAGWIRWRRDDLLTQRRLEARAASGGLLDASELPEFLRWVVHCRTPKGEELGVSESLHVLVQRSVAARRRRRGVLAAFVVGLVIAACIALWQRSTAVARAEEAARANHEAQQETVIAQQQTALAQQQTALAQQQTTVAQQQTAVARQQRVRAEQKTTEAAQNAAIARQRLAASYSSQGYGLLDSHPARAASYLFAARETGEDDVSLRMLFRWASQGLPVRRLVDSGALAWSPDGRYLTSAGATHARIWDPVTGDVTALPAFASPLDRVHVIAWSPDGTQVAEASIYGATRIWQVASGQPVTPLLVHPGDVNIIAWSPDGTRVATASHDEVRIWSVATGKLVTPPLRIESAATISCVTWSPDGTRLAAGADTLIGSGDETARIWNTSTGEPVIPALAAGYVYSIAWSPAGDRIAIDTSGTSESGVRILDAFTGVLIGKPLEHRGRDVALSFSPDGKRLAAAGYDGTGRVWSLEHQRDQPQLLAHGDRVLDIAWSPDGDRVATASRDGTARVWDVVIAEPVTPPLEHQGEVVRVVWSPDGKQIATESTDGVTRIWSAVNGGLTVPAFAKQGLNINAIAWSPDGQRLATANEIGYAQIWDARTTTEVTPPLVHRLTDIAWGPDLGGLRNATMLHDGHAGVVAVAWSPDGTRVATASKDDTAQVWNASTGDPVTPPLAHAGLIDAVAWSPDGKRIATGSYDGTARIWSATTGKPMTPPLVTQGNVKAVAWNADGNRLTTARLLDGRAPKTGDTWLAQVWNTVTGKEIVPSTPHAGVRRRVIIALGWSADAMRVATEGDSPDSGVDLWDAVSGRRIAPTLPRQNTILGVTNIHFVMWSPDATRVVISREDPAAHVWDARQGRELVPPLPHQDDVRAVAWSPDGRRIATGSADGTVRVWDASSGRPLTPPLLHHGVVVAIAWSPDGQHIATVADGVRVWDLVDGGTLASWRAILERSDYRFNAEGVPVAQDDRSSSSARPLKR